MWWDEEGAAKAALVLMGLYALLVIVVWEMVKFVFSHLQIGWKF